MSQDHLIGVSRSVNACLHKVNSSTGPIIGGQTSDQAVVAGGDVMWSVITCSEDRRKAVDEPAADQVP